VGIFAVAPDNGYLIAASFAAIGVLFTALGKIATTLLARTDKAHAEIIAELRSRLDDEQKRSDRYESLVLRTLDASEEAARVAREAVARRNT
jgi:formylmethanofuran dehydrogenase subunit E